MSASTLALGAVLAVLAPSGDPVAWDEAEAVLDLEPGPDEEGLDEPELDDIDVEEPPDAGQGGGSDGPGSPWPETGGDPPDDEPAAGHVAIDGARWRSLQPERPVRPGPMILERRLELTAKPDGIAVFGRWHIRSATPGWLATHLVGPEAHVQQVRWQGRDAVVWASGQGPMVVEEIDGEGWLELRAFLPRSTPEGDDVVLRVLGAPRGTVQLHGFPEARTVRSEDGRPVLARADGWATGSTELRLVPPRPSAPAEHGPLVVARVGVGLTVGDAEVRGRARLRWEIRQGSRTALSFSARGLGEDLTVQSPQISGWNREGDVVHVQLPAATQGLVDLDLRWSVAAPPGVEASVPMPAIEPLDVFRSAYSVQLARDGEVDVRPQLATWAPVATVQLPEWGQGLVEGSPTAAFTRARTADPGSLELLRLEPVPGPAAVVDVADLQIATTEDGRMLVQARYEVRNERASHLALVPPAGLEVVGVVVAGREVRPATDADGALRIPLKRSTETVEGLLAVPVTVAMLGQGDAFARRERRELALPVVDAPVNVQRVTLHLPPGYRSRLDEGDDAVVRWFDRGDEVGYGTDDDTRRAQADQLVSAAVDAWNDNEFDDAQRALDELSSLGIGGQAVEGLQGNLDLVRPRPVQAPAPAPDPATIDYDGDAEESYFRDELDVMPAAAPAPMEAESAVARRIKAKARARSGKKQADLTRRKDRAKALRNEGRYSEAAAEYRAAIDDSRDLDALQDAESVEYQFEADQLEGELRAVEAQSGGGSSIVYLVAPDDELDLVSAAAQSFVVVVVDDDADAPSPELTPIVDPATGPLVVIPRVGQAVRYQHLLLAGGEERTVRIDARRRRGDAR